MYVDIVISNIFHLNKHFFFSFLFLYPIIEMPSPQSCNYPIIVMPSPQLGNYPIIEMPSP